MTFSMSFVCQISPLHLLFMSLQYQLRIMLANLYATIIFQPTIMVTTFCTTVSYKHLLNHSKSMLGCISVSCRREFKPDRAKKLNKADINNKVAQFIAWHISQHLIRYILQSYIVCYSFQNRHHDIPGKLWMLYHIQ